MEVSQKWGRQFALEAVKGQWSDYIEYGEPMGVKHSLKDFKDLLDFIDTPLAEKFWDAAGMWNEDQDKPTRHGKRLAVEVAAEAKKHYDKKIVEIQSEFAKLEKTVEKMLSDGANNKRKEKENES
jgi:hypothetical protein